MLLEEVFECVYASRKREAHNSDIYPIRANWIEYKWQIRSDLLGGNCQLLPMDVYSDNKGEIHPRWSSKDAILLNVMSIVADREVLQKIGVVYHKNSLIDDIKNIWNKILEVVKKPRNVKGFKVLQWRWIVQSTLTWLSNFRKLIKDYKRSDAMVAWMYIAMINVMTARMIYNLLNRLLDFYFEEHHLGYVKKLNND